MNQVFLSSTRSVSRNQVFLSSTRSVSRNQVFLSSIRSVSKNQVFLSSTRSVSRNQVLLSSIRSVSMNQVFLSSIRLDINCISDFMGFVLLNLQFSVSTIACLFVLFILAIVMSIIRITTSDYLYKTNMDQAQPTGEHRIYAQTFRCISLVYDYESNV